MKGCAKHVLYLHVMSTWLSLYRAWIIYFNFNDDLFFEFTKYLLPEIKILNEILNCIEYTFYDPDHLPIHKIINYFDLNSWQPTLWLILPITYYSLPPIITLDIWAFIILTTKQYGSRPHIFMNFFTFR